MDFSDKLPFADLEITTCDGTLWYSKFALMGFSPAFASLDKFANGIEGKITFPDISTDAMNVILNFAYLQSEPYKFHDVEITKEIVMFLDQWQMTSMYQFIFKGIDENFDPECKMEMFLMFPQSFKNHKCHAIFQESIKGYIVSGKSSDMMNIPYEIMNYCGNFHLATISKWCNYNADDIHKLTFWQSEWEQYCHLQVDLYDTVFKSTNDEFKKNMVYKIVKKVRGE